MTVKELIKELKTMDPDRIVVMSSDGEGNSYSPLYCLYSADYKAESKWSGIVGFSTLSEDDIKQGYTEEDVLVGGKPCVVLCPTN